MSYYAAFMLEVTKYAKENGTRAAERMYGLTEKMIRNWRNQEELLKTIPKTKRTSRGSETNHQFEEDLKTWIVIQKSSGISVSTKIILFEARKIAQKKMILISLEISSGFFNS